MDNVLFVIYDDVGNILQHGSCPSDVLDKQASSGRNVLAGDGTYDKHYVLNGAIVPYSDAELQAKNNLAQGFVWKMPDRATVDTRNLDAAKVQAWERIKISRAVAEVAPFVCGGATYDRDLARISGAVQLALLANLSGSPFSVAWTLADNTVKTLDGPGMIAVGEALGVKTQSIFDTARQLRDQINAATTVTQVDAIVWPPGA